jgi:L-rhamnose mutarotase
VPRYCFTLQVDPTHLAEYRRRHAAVWPDMLRALNGAGWQHYTLHLREDGLLVGVVDADDLAAAQQAMEVTEVNARWQADMAPFFAGLDDGRPDRGFAVLPMIFDLDAQLGDLPERSPGHPAAIETSTPAAASTPAATDEPTRASPERTDVR